MQTLTDGTSRMGTMKKWIVAAALSASGLAIFVLASVMTGRVDRGQIAEAQAQGVSGGPFNGSGQELLHGVFLWLLAFAIVIGLVAFGIAALVKGRSRALAGTSYGTLYYWCGLMPVVAVLLVFPAWALWGALDCLRRGQ
jgi:hypothetical protein